MVSDNENGARSGVRVLALLATPLNLLLLKSLFGGPKSQVELRRDTGTPAQTTLRTQLKHLEGIGAIERNRRNGFPGVLDYELNAAGRDLLHVAEALEQWLARGPKTPLALNGESARVAIKALTGAWSATILRALAASPLSLTELDRVIASLSYPSLDRRLAALRLAGQVEATTGNGRGIPQALTQWAREGAGPIVAAARWEHRHMPRTATSFGRIDAEAVFFLAIPLLQMTTGVSGSCRMAMEVSSGQDGRRLAGVMVQFRNGRVASCTSRLEGNADAWALGSPAAWFDALVAADADRIEPGGDGRLISDLLDALHGALFDSKVPSS